jgi:hypothetical protein
MGRRHDAAQEGRSRGGVGVLVELDVGELRDAVDRQEHAELAGSEAQLADVDMDVADLGLGEAAAPCALLLGRGQAGDAMPLKTAVECAAGQLRDRVAQASQHVVERQQRAAPELDDHGFLERRQHGAAGVAWSHRRIGDGGARPPLGDRLRVQAVSRGKGSGALLRCLELGSNTRRRAGATMKNLCHRASSS